MKPSAEAGAEIPRNKIVATPIEIVLRGATRRVLHDHAFGQIVITSFTSIPTLYGHRYTLVYASWLEGSAIAPTRRSRRLLSSTVERPLRSRAFRFSADVC